MFRTHLHTSVVLDVKMNDVECRREPDKSAPGTVVDPIACATVYGGAIEQGFLYDAGLLDHTHLIVQSQWAKTSRLTLVLGHDAVALQRGDLQANQDRTKVCLVSTEKERVWCKFVMLRR